jgi:hypothetical protein
MRYLTWMKDANGEGFWERMIEYPFPPHKGLIVGGVGKIKKVCVCQGGLDGTGEVTVQLRTDDGSVNLEKYGWKWRE